MSPDKIRYIRALARDGHSRCMVSLDAWSSACAHPASGATWSSFFRADTHIASFAPPARQPGQPTTGWTPSWPR